jgi:hypothetical protein
VIVVTDLRGPSGPADGPGSPRTLAPPRRHAVAAGSLSREPNGRGFSPGVVPWVMQNIQQAQFAGRRGTGLGMTPPRGFWDFWDFGKSRASAIAEGKQERSGPGDGRLRPAPSSGEWSGAVHALAVPLALAAIHPRSGGPYRCWMVERPARRPGEARRGPRPPRSTVGVATRRTPARPGALVRESGARGPDRGPHGRFVTEAIKIAVCDQMVQA